MSLTIMEALKKKLIAQGTDPAKIKTNNIAALVDMIKPSEKASLNIANAIDASIPDANEEDDSEG